MIAGSARSTALYCGNGRALTKTRCGFKMFVDPSDISIAPHLLLDGVWEEWTEAVLRKLVRPGMHAVEVGANVGFFTLVLAQCVGERGRVLAFEADAALASIARDNVEINGFERRCEVVHAAAGERTGTATFYAAARQRGNGTLLADFEQLEHNPEAQRTRVEVAMTTLDDICAARALAPNIVKIDAEGAETMVLRGAEQLLAGNGALTVVLEFVPRFVRAAGDDPASFLQRFVDRGFRLHRIDERKRAIAPAGFDALLALDASELVLIRGEA